MERTFLLVEVEADGVFVWNVGVRIPISRDAKTLLAPLGEMLSSCGTPGGVADWVMDEVRQHFIDIDRATVLQGRTA